MQKEDRRFAWGYDDCRFYKRAFDYLQLQSQSQSQLQSQSENSTKTFAYFAVSMHHFPFQEERFNIPHPYPHPQNYQQRYLNSLTEQDYCLKEFWQHFKAYRSHRTHLFIVGDHPIFLKDQFDLLDRFQVFLMYIPPPATSNKVQYPQGIRTNIFPAQDQLAPTILELLSNRNIPQSFAFSLRGEVHPPPNYRDCHLLSHPWEQLISVAHQQVYFYEMNTMEIKKSTLLLAGEKNENASSSLAPIRTLHRLSRLEEFYQNYACSR